MTVSEPPSATRSATDSEAPEIGLRNAKRVGASDLELAHRDAVRDLRGIFAKACDQQKLLEFSEPPFAFEAAGPVVHLTEPFNRRRQPR